MKRILFVISLLTLVITETFAQNPAYVSAMEKAVGLLSEFENTENNKQAVSQLERIVAAEPKEWLPNYWAAYGLVNLNYAETDADKKDITLEKAEKFAATAEKLQPNNDEIEVLKAYIASARMAVSPQDRWQKYGGNIYLKSLDANHIFTTWGGNIFISASKGVLRGKTMGGRLEINNCDATIDAKTWGGKVILSDNAGDVHVKTLGGNIKIKNQIGKVHASTSGGDISGDGLKGELQCSTWGGNIKLYGIEGDIGANTKGGNIEAEIKSVSKYIWLDTAGGNIKVALPLNQAIDVDISSSKVIVPPLQNFEGYRTQDQLVGKLNGGRPTVKVKGTGRNIKVLAELQRNDKVTDSFIKRQSPTIDTNYVSLNFSSFFFGLFFCLLLTYGLSSIVYFTFQNIDTKINAQNPLTNIEKIVFLSNIVNGLSSYGAVATFIQSLDKKIYQNWFKYLFIIAFTLILVELSQFLLGIFSLDFLRKSKRTPLGVKYW